jgi:hypothetical protein
MAKTYSGQVLGLVQEWMEAEGADVANLDAASEWRAARVNISDSQLACRNSANAKWR